jgi:hypothetical protein
MFIRPTASESCFNYLNLAGDFFLEVDAKNSVKPRAMDCTDAANRDQKAVAIDW